MPTLHTPAPAAHMPIAMPRWLGTRTPSPMKLWEVKHTDIAGHRRRMTVASRTNGDAMDCAERMFGDARAMSAMRQGRAR